MSVVFFLLSRLFIEHVGTEKAFRSLSVLIKYAETPRTKG